MKQSVASILALSIALTSGPVGFAPFAPTAAEASQRGRDLGFTGRPTGRPSGGARTRLPKANAPTARPASSPPKTQLPTKPAAPQAKPAVPQVKPAVPQVKPAVPQARPAVPLPPDGSPAQTPGLAPDRKPATPRPSLPGSDGPVVRPAPGADISARPGPAARTQAGAAIGDRRAPGVRPPGANLPGSGTRPGGNRPPGWHPPHHRPPSWRPPYHRPPYYRPPHHHWGIYHWHPTWGWFFTAAIVGSTLAFVTNIDDDGCERIQDGGETLYLCDGVLYRSTYYEEQKVYEIVSDPPEERVELTTVVGLAVTDPLTQGQLVRDLQNRLIGAGYDVGTTDGIYGTSTRAAVEWLQYDNELEATGVVDAETAKLLNF